MLAAKGLDDARRQPALRVVARGIPYHLFFVRQLRIEQQRIVPMKAPACHSSTFCPVVGTKHRTISSVGVLIPSSRPRQKTARDNNRRPHWILPGFRYAAKELQAPGEF